MTAKVPIPLALREAPFTVADGLAAGLGRRRLDGADLARPFYGARAVERPTSIDMLCRAYLPLMPPDAVFARSTAAVLMGVPLPRRLEFADVIHVAVPPERRAPRGRGVIGHRRPLHPTDRVIRLGLPLTAPGATWCDLSKQVGVDDLVAAGDYLIHWQLPMTTHDELARRVGAMAGHRGVEALRAALPLLDERSESRRESLLRLILIRGGITGIVANYWISLPGVRKSYRVDFAIPKSKVIVEYQSDYHRDPAQWRADMTRISRLEAHGWVVVQVNADDLLDPRELVARIARVLATR